MCAQACDYYADPDLIDELERKKKRRDASSHDDADQVKSGDDAESNTDSSSDGDRNPTSKSRTNRKGHTASSTRTLSSRLCSILKCSACCKGKLNSPTDPNAAAKLMSDTHTVTHTLTHKSEMSGSSARNTRTRTGASYLSSTSRRKRANLNPLEKRLLNAPEVSLGVSDQVTNVFFEALRRQAPTILNIFNKSQEIYSPSAHTHTHTHTHACTYVHIIRYVYILYTYI